MRLAIQNEDVATLRHAAHTLKGALGTFGDSPPLATAQDLEAMARSNNLADVKAIYQILAQQMANLQAYGML